MGCQQSSPDVCQPGKLPLESITFDAPPPPEEHTPSPPITSPVEATPHTAVGVLGGSSPPRPQIASGAPNPLRHPPPQHGVPAIHHVPAADLPNYEDDRFTAISVESFSDQSSGHCSSNSSGFSTPRSNSRSATFASPGSFRGAENADGVGDLGQQPSSAVWSETSSMRFGSNSSISSDAFAVLAKLATDRSHHRGPMTLPAMGSNTTLVSSWQTGPSVDMDENNTALALVSP